MRKHMRREKKKISRTNTNQKDRRRNDAAGEDIRVLLPKDVSYPETEERSDALRDREEQYQRTLETMEEGYFEVDLAGNMNFANEAICRMSRIPRRELIGMNFREYMDEGTTRNVRELFNQVYKTGQPVKLFEWAINRKDGTRAVMESSVYVIRNGRGEPVGFRGIVRDITERKQLEEDLRIREERYRTLLESMEEGYYELDLRGSPIFVNNGLCKMARASERELIGLDYHRYLDEEEAPKAMKLFGDVYRTSQPITSVELDIIRLDGTRYIQETSVYLMRDALGKPIGFRGITRDTTERKNMEKALQEREERFRQVAENTGEWIWEVDAKGLYTYSNPVVERILGYKPEELVGKKYFYDLFCPEEKEYLKEAALKIFRNRETVRNLVNLNLHKDGHAVYLESNGAPILDGEGNLTGYLGVDTDISERRRAEEERENLIRDLRDALANIKVLRGMLPICASCKKIRDDRGYWKQIESYIRDHSEAEFSHSICPDCQKKLYPEYMEVKKSKQ